MGLDVFLEKANKYSVDYDKKMMQVIKRIISFIVLMLVALLYSTKCQKIFRHLLSGFQNFKDLLETLEGF